MLRCSSRYKFIRSGEPHYLSASVGGVMEHREDYVRSMKAAAPDVCVLILFTAPFGRAPAKWCRACSRRPTLGALQASLEIDYKAKEYGVVS